MRHPNRVSTPTTGPSCRTSPTRELSLEEGRRFLTQVAGLFVFFPLLMDLDLPRAVVHAERPVRSRSRLCRRCSRCWPPSSWQCRVSHISDLCHDEARDSSRGLNVLPKVTYATDYSYKTERAMTERLIAAVIAKTPFGRPSPELQPRLPRHPLSWRRT